MDSVVKVSQIAQISMYVQSFWIHLSILIRRDDTIQG